MNIANSLFTRIFLWFIVNVFLIFGLLVCYFLLQKHTDIEQIFHNTTSDRLFTAARVISHDLEETESRNWSILLKQHADNFGITFAVILESGKVYSSDKVTIPQQLRNKIEEHLHAKRAKIPQHITDEQKGIRGHRDKPKRIEKITLHTKNPDLYWSGVALKVTENEPLLSEYLMLFAVSDSRSGNGFFFDPFPWILMIATLLLVSVLLWIPMVKNITRPLKNMAKVMEGVGRGKFDVRLEVKRKDEIGSLASSVNQMISRLGYLVQGQKRFLGDISHELGSPIARIQFGLAALEQRVDEKSRYRVEEIIEDVAHMAGLINELLSFSRAESDQNKVTLQATPVLPVIQEVIRREAGAEIDVVTDVDTDLVVIADEKLLARALGNILRNAIQHAGSYGPIQIQARLDNGMIQIEVKDNGPGVPIDHIDQLFEPFYRVDGSRNKETGGVGLGLSIVKTCINACKGSVSAKNGKPSGFAVTIILKIPESHG